ncbi:MAG: FAD-dependent thymidylate synthase [Verrucomicrobia bacterium]|nr:FAD-dependent thymidylate synthase [Verrucomicrobiota bacterium]MBU4427796.1 FAD-dependent thymidylate synthase [Verrucomicrobiota bacterium]MCG2681377.1 FAD-dependent thymidylate synthase [Kiritimatiellia bacterium]
MNVKLLAVTENAEALIEYAARVCYQSTGRCQPGTSEKFLQRLISQGHESPLEHAYATFHISGCSRAMTHQLVRHRLMSVSQQSQRYVTESNFEYVMPPSVADKDKNEYGKDMEVVRAMYAKWKERGLKNEDARFVLPNACVTEIVISANFREFRHIFQVRCTRHAQWEIRQACCEMLKILNKKAPHVFDDLLPLIEKCGGE